MTEKEYLEKRVKVHRYYQVQKIDDNGFAYWNLLKESIEKILSAGVTCLHLHFRKITLKAPMITHWRTH